MSSNGKAMAVAVPQMFHQWQAKHGKKKCWLGFGVDPFNIMMLAVGPQVSHFILPVQFANPVKGQSA